ncbi:hypothetical protein PG994_012324 [Apiospora phragmitis]|uniref:Uncharacterized protein n=1 Tax=Apiospora phragmitis TaxID=2905665 RepID=A0ABR1TVB5_9PEZI
MNTTKDSFTLEAGPDTDIWRKPPTTDVWNANKVGDTAPISRTSSGQLKKFQSARVTFWADWTERYDQGGLLLALKRVSAPTAPTAPTQPSEKWVKTGVEFYQGAPMLSTVATDRWADWSVGPLGADAVDPAKGVTLEIVREGDENGKSAWVYRLIRDEAGRVKEKVSLREICWIFADEDDKDGEEWLLDVSPLVARPAKTSSDSLKVNFFEFEVKWLS